MRLRPLTSLALLLAAALAARAQDSERYPLSGAHVPDNRQASDKFDRAMGLLKGGSAREGVKRLLELQDEYADKLILYGTVGRYVSARQLVVRVSREMTPETLAEYRAQADPRVDLILRSAREAADLRRIARDYPMATRAPEALQHLATMLLDAGDLAGAADVLDDLLALPHAGTRAPEAAARLAYCRGALNDGDALTALEGRAKAWLDSPVSVRGRKSTVKEAIQGARKRLRADDDAAPAWARWPTLGGGPARDRIAAGLKALPAASARFELVEGAVRSVENSFNRGGFSAWSAGTRDYTPVHPAADDGVLVVNEGHQAWAVDLVGGAGSRRLLTPNPFSPAQILFDERAMHAVTLDSGRAYFPVVAAAEREQNQLGWLTVVYPIPLRRLTCVEVQSGRLVWETGGEDAGKEFEKRASYHGAPVVTGGRVYAAATFWVNPTDLVEHWVVCLDAATGSILWRTFVASGMQEINLFNNNTRESIPCSLTLFHDRIFTCTNLGAVGCVDRLDGGLLWVRRYPRYPVQPVHDPYDIPRQPPAWLNNPIVGFADARDGRDKMLVTPLDSPFLFCMTADDGEILWRYSCHDEDGMPRRNRDGVRLRYLLGVRDGVVYLQGSEMVALTTSGKLSWFPDPPVRPDFGEPCGRGLVAADGVYVPTTLGLQKFGLKDPKQDRQFWRWKDGDRNAGNLVMVDQALVTAANSALTVFYDAAKITAFFEAEAQRNPGSAYLRYRLALAHLESGDVEKAEAALRGALALAEKRRDDAAAAIAAACRRTLFRNRIAAAQLASRRDEHERAAGELEKARAWADAPDAWLELLRGLGDAWRRAGQPARAVAALQEIIESWGDEPWQRTEPARTMAQREIAAILAASGRAPYAPFEKQAADLLARARAAGDAARFAEVIRRFPNAAAAEEAAFGIGQSRLAASDWPAACEAHQRFLRDYPASPSAPQALAELAVAFEKRGMWGAAGGALRRLRRGFAEAEIRIEGGGIRAGKFAEARLAQPAYRAADAGAEPPALAFPVEKKWSWTPARTAEARVLTPEGARPWKSEVVLAVAGAQVFAADAATGTTLWKAEAPRGTRWAGWSGALLLLAGDSGLVAVREGGEVAWKASPECSILYSAREAEGTLFIACRNRLGNGSFLAAWDAASGARAWSAEMAPNHHLRDFWVTSDALAWRSRDDTGFVLTDRDSGAVASRFPCPASRVIPAGPDRFVVLTPASQIAMVDAATGKQVWTHPHAGLRLENTLDVRGGYVTLAAFEGESWRLKVLDAETGKLAADTDLKQIWLKQFLTDGRNAYFVFKEPAPPNLFVAGAYQLSTGRQLWETKLEGGITSMFPALNARDHVLLNCPTYRKDQRVWAPLVIALDKNSGKESGRIEGRPDVTPTYAVEAVPGRVLLTQDDTVEGWGR